MTVQKRSYTSGHFELMIDGHRSTAYLKSVDGGATKGSLVDEPIGPDNQRIKHMSTIDVEPFSIDFGIAGAKDILKWIQNSWRKNFARRTGQITHANFDLKATFRSEFYDALITETTFPALDGSAKEAAYMKIKVLAERTVESLLPATQSVEGTLGSKQKMWTPSSFRFNIDGIDDARFANKIESFTIKQGVKKFYTGQGRHAQIEPTKVDFPNITGTIAMQYADKFLQWHRDYVQNGQRDTKAQKTGSIEFLGPDKKQILFAINLYEMGLISAAVGQSTANSDQIKRVKFELYVGRMDLDGSYVGMEG
ncbi:MAG: phage tail protein [Kofleriaceae bacterium]